MINLEKKSKEVESIPYVQTQYCKYVRVPYGPTPESIISDELIKGSTLVKHVRISEHSHIFVFQKSEDEIKELHSARWSELCKMSGKSEYE